MNLPTQNKEWEYLELNDIYFNKPQSDQDCHLNKPRGSSAGGSRIEGLGEVAQHRYKDKSEFLRHLRQCLNWNPKFDSKIRNQYQKLIQIGYQPEWLEKIESHQIPRQWEKENFEAHLEQKLREAEANSKVEMYLTLEKNSYNTEQSSEVVQAPKVDQKRRSISITVQSIEETTCSEENNKSPVSQELSKEDSSSQYIKKAYSLRRSSDATIDTDAVITQDMMRPRIHSSNTIRHSKGKISLMDAGRDSVFSEVNEFSSIDTGRRTEARIRQLEHDIKSEMKSIKANKSKAMKPPRPTNTPKVGVEFETISKDGSRSRRQLFVSCSNQILSDQVNKEMKFKESMSQLSISRIRDNSTKESSRSKMTSRFNDNPSIYSLQQSMRGSSLFRV